MPTKRFQQFAADIARARDLVGLGQSIGGLTHGRVDASDLYRAGLAQSIAALDAYVHGVVLDRGVDLLLGRLSHVSAPRTKVGLDFGVIFQLLAAGTPADRELAARAHVAQRLSRETYQRPDDIAQALAMVGISRIWSTAFPNPQATKTALGLIVDRRNRIVHNCDVDPLVPGEVTSLTAADALDAIAVVGRTVSALDAFC